MTTLERLQTILLDNYPLTREALTPDVLLADMEIDSLGVMELFFSIEDAFTLTVPNDKVDVKTLGDVVVYIDRLIAEQHGGNMETGAKTGTAA